MKLNPAVREIEAIPGDTVLESSGFMKGADLRELCKLVWGFYWREAEIELIKFNGKVNITGFIREMRKIKEQAQ